MSVVWKTIPEFDKYEASRFGEIRNKRTKILLKQKERPNGYMSLTLVVDAKLDTQKTSLIHRLISSTFLENENNYPTVNHIDFDKKNNHVSNLEWASYAQQAEHKKQQQYEHIPCNREVNRIDQLTGGVLQTYDSLTDAGKWCIDKGLSKSKNPMVCIGRVCLKQPSCKTAYGFIWKYTGEVDVNDEWEQIQDYLIHGKHGYFVSNTGRVKGKTGKILRQTKSTGTVRVSIASHTYTVRQLVARVYLSNPNNLPFVMAIDGDNTNCNVSNLKWMPRVNKSLVAKNKN